LKTNDSKEFTELLNSVLSIYRTSVTAGALSIWFEALKQYSIEEVRFALDCHTQDPDTGVFSPKPAHLIGILQARDGRPGAEESWTRLSHAIGDQGATIVLTAEERVAFFVADAIAEDKIAARMAFKEVYEKTVREARSKGAPVIWGKILGHDPSGREGPIMEAVRLGRLPLAEAAALLPYSQMPQIDVEKTEGSPLTKLKLSAQLAKPESRSRKQKDDTCSPSSPLAP
jgi:hypothetical protein